MLRRINPALPGLLAGIVLYGVVIQFTGMWFVDDKQQYTIGLWIGILLAMGMAVNMAVVILDAVDVMASTGTAVRTGFWSVLRYVVVIGAFVGVWYFEVGNLLVMFLGVMGLKVSAYLQPLLHRFILRLRGFYKRDNGTAE
ncbi:MAG: hypothetical protein HFI74_11860 [Lachnospiraceae bacterium]|nr:hypothetical protein [Lachnospiraceae bacterium]